MIWSDLRREAEAAKNWILSLRRQLHKHPELMYEEFRTSQLVQDTLSELQIPFEAGIAETGVVGTLGSGDGRVEGPVLGLADGESDSVLLGSEDGFLDGLLLGSIEGFIDGPTDGLPLGSSDGFPDGSLLGTSDGILDGPTLGASDGKVEGAGELLGFEERVGEIDGFELGT